MGVVERQRDELAAQLKEALIDRRRADAAAGRLGGDEIGGAVRELVEHEAAILSAADREELAAASCATPSASARSRSCSPTPRSRR